MIKIVGLSNMLDRELARRKPVERPHGEIVGAAVVDSKLLGEVVKGKESVGRIEAFLILPVAAFHLAVVAWCIGADQLVPDTQLGGSGFKQGGEIPLTVGETIGELKTIVSLDTLHLDPPACVPFDQLFQEVSGGIGGLLRVGCEETQASELVNGGILEQTQLRVCDASAGNHFHIHLNPLSRIGHQLIGLWFVWFLLFRNREHPQLTHHPEQTLRAARVSTLTQPMPQLHHTEGRITTAHIINEFQFLFCMLVWVTVRTSGLAGQRFHTAVPAGFPEVDI